MHAKRRLELVALFAEEGRFDLEVACMGSRRVVVPSGVPRRHQCFARLTKPPVIAVFAPLAAAGRIALCSPVAFELGFSARNHDDFVAVTGRVLSFPMIPVTDADHRRASSVQELLAAKGQQRALSLVDALVAAAAEAHDLTVLHYDANFELVAAVTGQQQQWVVKRGTADSGE